jgi:hypothetical protein
MRRGLCVATLVGWVLLSYPTAAHHSVAAQFDMSRKTTLVGTVVRVGWINPHPFVLLDVKGTSGTVQWTLSTQPLATLLDAGITKGLLAGKPGEAVTAVVHPALDGRRTGWVARLTYADGRFFSLFEP